MSKPSTSPSPKRMRAQARGRWAERLVAWGLRLTGWRIVAQNYKTQVGELDLVATRGNVLSIVEVKARTDEQTALDAITPKQQARIQRATEQFLIHHPVFQSHDMRFDVAWVKGPWRFKLYKDAWRL